MSCDVYKHTMRIFPPLLAILFPGAAGAILQNTSALMNPTKSCCGTCEAAAAVDYTCCSGVQRATSVASAQLDYNAITWAKWR